MKKDKIFKSIMILIIIAELLLIFVISNDSEEDDHCSYQTLNSCRRVYEIKEDDFLENKKIYEGDYAYLNFAYFAKRNNLNIDDEACAIWEDDRCIKLNDEQYYYDIRAILENLKADSILSKEALQLDYADYLMVCEDAVYENTLFYKLLNEDFEIIPIPSAYNNLNVTMISHFNGEDVQYHTDTYAFFAKQDNDINDGYANVALSLTEIDEAYLLSLSYSYVIDYEDTTYNRNYEKDIRYVAYAYVLK